jgi:MFS-type transporter involved in bile tolerance (Atg22 family)
MFIPVIGSTRRKPNSHDRFDDMQPEAAPGTLLKTIAMCAVGWLTGYLISAVSSILLFLIGHIQPHQPASAAVMWITAIYGIVFAVLGAIVGASFSRKNAIGIGAAIALTIGVVAMWSWYASPNDSHWSHAIAILLMAPAAQFGALARRLD